jgi:hypothetical protein
MAVTLSIIVTDNANGTLTFTPATGGSATQSSGTTLTAPIVTASANTDAAKQGIVAQGILKALEYVKNSYAQASDVDTDN